MTAEEAKNKRVQEYALRLLFQFGINTFPLMRQENLGFDQWWQANCDEESDSEYQLINWFESSSRTENERDFALRWALDTYGDDAVVLASLPGRGGGAGVGR